MPSQGKTHLLATLLASTLYFIKMINFRSSGTISIKSAAVVNERKWALVVVRYLENYR